jgi:hypothetical protein
MLAEAAAANQASEADWPQDEIDQQLVMDPDAGFPEPAQDVA